MNRLFARAGQDGAALLRGDWMGKTTAAEAKPRPYHVLMIEAYNAWLAKGGTKVSAAAAAGVSDTTIDNFTDGEPITGRRVATFVQIMEGLGHDPDRATEGYLEPNRRRGASLEERIRVVRAVPHLAVALETVVNAMYAEAQSSK